MMAIIWVHTTVETRARAYMVPKMATRRRIWGPAAAQLPVWKLASMTAMIFCINTVGRLPTMALKRMHTRATGMSTGKNAKRVRKRRKKVLLRLMG